VVGITQYEIHMSIHNSTYFPAMLNYFRIFKGRIDIPDSQIVSKIVSIFDDKQ